MPVAKHTEWVLRCQFCKQEIPLPDSFIGFADLPEDWTVYFGQECHASCLDAFHQKRQEENEAKLKRDIEDAISRAETVILTPGETYVNEYEADVIRATIVAGKVVLELGAFASRDD